MKKYLLALWGGAERLLETHIGWVLVLFVLNYFTIVWQNVTTYHEAELPVLLIDGVFLFAGTGVYVLLLCCIPWRWLRRLLLWTSFLLSAALAGLEVFAITTYSTLVGAGIITAILQTNPREAGEFIEMYFGWHFLVSVGGFLLVVFIASRFIFPRRFSIFSRRVRNVLFPLVFVAGCIAGVVLLKGYMSFIKSNMLDIPPVRVGAATITSVENIKAYQKLSGEMKNTIRLTQNDSDTPQVVLILGEATARHRLHLYGYPLDNTPNLDALAQQGDIAVFRDVIAPEGATVAVLQKLLTFADQESMAAGRPWYQENNMIDLMNAAGYQTHWISNQESSGIWGNVAQLFANRCTTRRFTRMRESHEDNGSLDEELFPLVDEAMAQGSGRDFYVIHLMGGHGLYYFRYPYLFTKFDKDHLPAPENGYDEKKRTEIAQYENAIFYNDFVVSSLIGKFQGKNALIFYIPDHGEEVYDENSAMSGHVEENPTRYMLEIPFIVWASPAYKAAHPDKWQAIQAAVQRPYMTDDFIDTLMDLLDLRTPEYDPARSVVNPAFRSSRPRIVQGRDYDLKLK